MSQELLDDIASLMKIVTLAKKNVDRMKSIGIHNHGLARAGSWIAAD